MPPGCETADGQKYACSVLQHKFRRIRKLYGTYVGKRTHTKAHSTVGEEHKKYKCKKKISLSPQVHTTDIPRDFRAHMDKSAFFSKYMILKR